MTTLLVIDDDPLVARLIASVVPPAWTIVPAPNGLIGLDLLRQRLAQRDAPDLIVLDLQMPGLDGYDTAVRIRQLASQIPLLILTGQAEDDDPLLDAYARELGGTVLRKRMNPAVLGQAIARACAEALPVQWSAVLARLQRHAWERERQARQQAAAHLALFARDAMLLLGLATLASGNHLLVVGTACTVEQLHAILAGQRVDVLVVAWQDTALVVDLAKAYQLLVVVVAPAATIAHSGFAQDDVVGVVYAEDPNAAAQLAEAIRAVRAGQPYRPALPTSTDANIPIDPRLMRAAQLTPREQALLALDRPGLAREVLARALGVTPKTIAQYRWRIRAKLEQAAAIRTE